MIHPPATILTISSRSPALSWRFENSEGATAWPLCSTTTLRGRSPCVTRNSPMVQGSLAGTSWPLAVRDAWVIERIFEQAGLRHLDREAFVRLHPRGPVHAVSAASQSFHTGS